MFNISWSELAVILLVGILVIGPKELPAVIKAVRKIIRKIKATGSELTKALLENEDIADVKKEADKINRDLNKIIDLDGNPQETYDISDIMDELSTKKSKKK